MPVVEPNSKILAVLLSLRLSSVFPFFLQNDNRAGMSAWRMLALHFQISLSCQTTLMTSQELSMCIGTDDGVEVTTEFLCSGNGSFDVSRQ